MTSRPWSVVAVWFVCFHLLFTSHNYHLLAILLWLHRAVPLSSRSAETTDGSHHGRPLQSDLHRHFHQSLQNFYHQAVKKLTISCLFLSLALNECLLNLKWWSVWIILLLLWTETLINAVKQFLLIHVFVLLLNITGCEERKTTQPFTLSLRWTNNLKSQ